MKDSNTTKLTMPVVWAMLIYIALCLYHFGTIMMVYFFDYAAFPTIHENVPAVFKVFNDQMLLVSSIPAVLMVAASINLFTKSTEILPRWATGASVVLGIISVATTFIFINPIHASLVTTGFTTEIEKQLLPIAMYFQIIPAILQLFIALYMMNDYAKNAKPLGRWLFILVFTSLFYSNGTGNIEGFVNYPFWSAIGDTDWIPYRQSGSFLRFFGTFIIPAFLPILLSIPLFWWRPKGIPRKAILGYWLANVWMFFITAIYFVPKIQVPLNSGYSLALIADLRTYDFPLRGSVVLLMQLLLAWMFLKIGQQKMQEAALK